jgi:uncharacterized protein (DUF1810 family)
MLGLGHSPMAIKFGITCRDEAHAYLKHPLLGSRLKLSTQLVVAVEGCSIDDIFGSTDSKKFCSSMTLFSYLDTNERIFKDALEKYFSGDDDPLTLDLLAE